MTEVVIGGRAIGKGGRPYFVAEIGSNHCGSVDTCKEMILAFSGAGADAVKLQKRDLRRMTKAMRNQPYDHEHSYGPTYGEHRAALEFDREQWRDIVDFARSHRITLFSTAFDPESVDFLQALDVPAYKVASGSITNTDLINLMAQTRKPIIVSVAYHRADVQRVIDTVDGRSPLVFLYCVPRYPCEAKYLGLFRIVLWHKEFPAYPWGVSDHYNGILSAVVAHVDYRAKMIEKHVTLNRASKGTDHAFSLEPRGFAEMVHYIEESEQMHNAQGDGYPPDVYPPAYLKLGASVHLTRPVKAGEVLNPGNCAVLAPNDLGIPAYRYGETIGRIAVTDLSTDVPLDEGKLK